MSEQNEIILPVTIELGPALHHLATPATVQTIEGRLQVELKRYLSDLGLSGDPAVTVAALPIERAVRLRVLGKIRPYTPELMRRAWWSVGPQHFAAQFDFFRQGADLFPDEWLMEAAASGTADQAAAIFDFLFYLTLYVICSRPGCLLDPVQAAAYMATDVATDVVTDAGADALNLSPADACSILRALLNRGVSLADRAKILSLWPKEAVDWNREQIFQQLFCRLRSHRVEIQAHPNYLWAITRREWLKPTAVAAPELEDKFRDPFATLADGFFYMLGVQLPDIYIVPSDAVPYGLITVKINDHSGAPGVGLRPDQILLNRPAQFDGEIATLHPAFKSQCAIIAATALPQESDSWDPYNYVVLFTFGELLRFADRLLTMDDTEYYLAQLEQAFPDLVNAVFTRYSLADITALLQALIREGISIRNLRAVLENLLQFAVIEADATQKIVFDDRLALLPGTTAGQQQQPAFYLEFVRQRLKLQVSHQYAPGQTLHVFLVDPEIEKRLLILHGVEANRGADQALTLLSEDEEEEFRNQVWYHLEADAGSTKPALLTSSQVRPFLRDLLMPELPDVPVLAYEELATTLEIRPLARISLDAGGA
jgi:hypothetical protein